MAHDGLQNITVKEKPEPIIVFLTDGEPTVGEVRPDKIQAVVKELNFDPEAAIFSLALGDDADFGFLNRLSIRNSGFARKIYEASDTALQLRDFYRQVASPLLANVTFSYQPEHVSFHFYYWLKTQNWVGNYISYRKLHALLVIFHLFNNFSAIMKP